jgi:hypothetical protein
MRTAISLRFAAISFRIGRMAGAVEAAGDEEDKTEERRF